MFMWGVPEAASCGSISYQLGAISPMIIQTTHNGRRRLCDGAYAVELFPLTGSGIMRPIVIVVVAEVCAAGPT